MKKLILALALPLIFTTSFYAQTDAEETGYDGDNFSLEGALELFKQSESLEDFEKKLNEEKNYVNNLDLNQDGEIDYIRVEDNMDGKVHAIVLQVPMSENESQDVAVIEIEETGKETAMLQIIGDEDLYGEQKIVEPFEEEASSSGKGGPNADYEIRGIVVNVYFWNPVRFIYAPRYRPWVSPYRWRVYPRWWSPWRPHPFSYLRTRRVVYHRSYRVVSTHRVVRAHKVYTPRRKTSVVVKKRTTTVRTTRKATGGKVVKGKTTTTTVKKKNGNVVGAKKSTTKVKKKNGNVVGGKKTTTKVKKKNGAVKGKKSTTKVKKKGNKTVKKKKTVKGKRGRRN